MVEIITPEVLSTPGLLSSPWICLGDDSGPGVDSTSGVIISPIILLSSQYLYTISLTLEEVVTSCQIWNLIAYFPDFTVRYGLKNLYEWDVYKTNIDCSFIQGMVENYCTLSEIQPWPTIHLGPTGLGE